MKISASAAHGLELRQHIPRGLEGEELVRIPDTLMLCPSRPDRAKPSQDSSEIGKDEPQGLCQSAGTRRDLVGFLQRRGPSRPGRHHAGPIPGQTLKQSLDESLALFGLIVLKHAGEVVIDKGAVANTSLIDPLEVRRSWVTQTACFRRSPQRWKRKKYSLDALTNHSEL